MSLATIRDGIKANISSQISGLRAFDTIPDQVPVPCAIVGAPELISWDHTFGRGKDRFTIPVRLYVARADDRTAQDKLDAYLAGTGSTSVKTAIESDRTLGGAADTVRVTEARGYGAYEIGGVTYLGVELVCDIVASP